MNDTQHQLDAKLFVTTVIDLLKTGSLDTEDAVDEICFYMAHVKGHNLASFLRQIVVKKMDGVSFEKFIALMFTLRGYKVEFTPSTGDQGVDLVAVRGEERIAIQCKRWDNSVGPEAVQQVFTGKSLYECTKVILVTTASLTPQAQKMANKLDITYWDKDSIEVLCEECVKKWDDATDIIQRFAPKMISAFGKEPWVQKVYDYIKRRGDVSRSDLLRGFSHRLTSKDLNEIINTLANAKKVGERVEQTGTGRGRKSKIIYFPRPVVLETHGSQILGNRPEEKTGEASFFS